MKKQLIATGVAVVLIIGAVVGYIMIDRNVRSTKSTMEFIAGRYRNGAFEDHDNAIAVQDASDIGYYFKNGKWYVIYGKLGLEFTKKDLQDPEILNLISKIGIDVRGNLEEDRLTWYWEGEKLEEWVP